MNGYIINPSWFYWISVVDTIKIVFIFLLVFAVCGVAAGIVCYCSACDDTDRKQAKLILNISAPVLIVTLLGVIFIPSRTTLIEMQVAKFATYENAEWSVEAVKSAVEYIIEAIKAVK